MTQISPLRPQDRAGWEPLARAYKAFYDTTVSDEGYEQVWRRLIDAEEIHGVAAHLDGVLVGVAHYLFHPTVWTGGSCYLQDLYVDEAARGHGVARALIDHVARAAADRGVSRLYWNTKVDNAAARALYDKVALFRGFIVYEHQPAG